MGEDEMAEESGARAERGEQVRASQPSTNPKDEPRTAVLVVHGMGNQRPLETMRGVFDAVWKNNPEVSQTHRSWVHPDRVTREVDLAVLTTDRISPTNPRRFDFHELYWAHLMSETRSNAVLLWLFALVRRGPRARSRSFKLAWFIAAPFLATTCTAALFLTLVLIRSIAPEGQFADLISGYSLLFSTSVLIGVIASSVFGPIGILILITLVLLAFVVLLCGPDGFTAEILIQLNPYTTIVIVPILGALFCFVTMRWWGLLALGIALLFWWLSWTAIWGNVGCAFPWSMSSGRLFEGDTSCLDFWRRAGPWSLGSVDMVWGAFTVLALYALLNAFFLQTVLGDAARYFRNTPSNVAVRRAIRRQALDHLEGLHREDRYDRIIVVAHSLGSVVAYDMLRAYWARVNRRIHVEGPVATAADTLERSVDPAVHEVWEKRSCAKTLDVAEPSPRNADKLRMCLHEAQDAVMRAISAAYDDAARAGWRNALADPGGRLEVSSPPIWKVTDFVTLGSPLTHGAYLLADADDRSDALAEFERWKAEYTFSTATARLDPTNREDGSLTYRTDGRRYFHHAALFGLTRWTNIYFQNTGWSPSLGDPIGGPLRDVFGWAIEDVAIDYSKTGASRSPEFMEHTNYWKGHPAHTHMRELCAALRLEFEIKPAEDQGRR